MGTAMGTITSSPNVSGYNKTDFATTLIIPTFDTTQGTVQSITLTVTTSQYSSILLTNNSAGSDTGSVSAEVDTYVFGGPNGIFGTYDGTGNSSNTAGTFNSVDVSGRQGYTLPSGQNTTLNFGSAASPIQATAMFGPSTDPTTLSYFETTGAGNVTANGQTFTVTNLRSSGGNTSAQQTTYASITGTVTYTYQPTPASPTEVSFGIGILIAGVGYVRRRTKKA